MFWQLCLIQQRAARLCLTAQHWSVSNSALTAATQQQQQRWGLYAIRRMCRAEPCVLPWIASVCSTAADAAVLPACACCATLRRIIYDTGLGDVTETTRRTLGRRQLARCWRRRLRHHRPTKLAAPELATSSHPLAVERVRDLAAILTDCGRSSTSQSTVSRTGDGCPRRATCVSSQRAACSIRDWTSEWLVSSQRRRTAAVRCVCHCQTARWGAPASQPNVVSAT